MAYRKPLANILNGVTRFGRLTVIGDAEDYLSPSGHKVRRATFLCDCGNIAAKRISEVRRGLSMSCGCYHSEKIRRHGHAAAGNGTPEYRTWTAMKYRCTNPRCKMWPDYGGRGITMCARWMNSFEAFLEDMGPRPEGCTIDRIDNDGPYTPENCRWATKREQAANRRSSVMVDFNGRRMTLKDAASVAGVEYAKVHSRLRAGWTLERALSA